MVALEMMVLRVLSAERAASDRALESPVLKIRGSEIQQR